VMMGVIHVKRWPRRARLLLRECGLGLRVRVRVSDDLQSL
jgi:hypothetical protein